MLISEGGSGEDFRVKTNRGVETSAKVKIFSKESTLEDSSKV